jgi:hypothetical protein
MTAHPAAAIATRLFLLDQCMILSGLELLAMAMKSEEPKSEEE